MARSASMGKSTPRTGVPTNGTAGPAMAIARNAATFESDLKINREIRKTSMNPPTIPTEIHRKTSMLFEISESGVLNMPVKSSNGKAYSMTIRFRTDA